MKDIVKVIQMMERGDKPKGFSHYTTSHKAKRPSIILEDELRSIDNVVKEHPRDRSNLNGEGPQAASKSRKFKSL